MKGGNLIHIDKDLTSAGGGWGRHPRGGRGGGWERGARLELLDDDHHHDHLPQLHRHQHLRLPPLHLWRIHLRHMWQINWKIHKQCCSCYTQRRGRFSNMPVMKDVKCIFYQKVANFTIYDISKLTVLLHKCSAFRFVSNSVLRGHKRSHVEDQTGFTELDIRPGTTCWTAVIICIQYSDHMSYDYTLQDSTT